MSGCTAGRGGWWEWLAQQQASPHPTNAPLLLPSALQVLTYWLQGGNTQGKWAQWGIQWAFVVRACELWRLLLLSPTECGFETLAQCTTCVRLRPRWVDRSSP